MTEEQIVSKKTLYPSLEATPEFREAVGKCRSPEDDLALLREGTHLWKIRSYSKWYHRKFRIGSEDDRLTYEPTQKASCYGIPTFIQISDIIDVRKGWKTDTFNKFGTKIVDKQKKNKLRKLSQRMSKKMDAASISSSGSDGSPAHHSATPPVVDEACCFSVIFGRDRSTMDLMAATPELASLWVRALRHLVTVMRGMQQEERFNKWLSQQFNIADKDKSGSLAFDECLRLLKQLNVNMSRAEAFKLFTIANTDEREIDGQPALDSKEFVVFFQMLMKRPEVEELYNRYARSTLEMSALELQHFLSKEQHTTMTVDECCSLIEAFEQSSLKTIGRISINGFTNLLLSEQMEIFEHTHRTVFQDMSQPLASYFIAASHNTYLLGRQIYDDSTMEGYVEALKRGCRVLELDCWDGPDGEPVITHGYALTSKIMFRDILVDAILPYAFTISEFPVILSLENHCTSEQQKRLAFHLSDVFGDMLYTEPVSEDMTQLPSPNDLRHKVLVKGRKVVPVNTPESESESEDDEDDSNASRNLKRLSSGNDKSISRSPQSISRSPQHSANGNMKALRVTDQTLSDLVSVCRSTHFHGFEQEGKCYEMVSLSEGKTQNLLKNKGKELVKFNTKRLSKIYPAGTRAGSSNFPPIPFWNAGCQILALNYQGTNKPVFFNEAKFRVNGCCGYVLKPDYLRAPDFEKYDYTPTDDISISNNLLLERKKIFRIRIISGQHLPKPDQETKGEIVDPYVKIKIFGHPIDKAKQQTHIISDNGFNPRWDSQFQFTIFLPELAFVYFIVKDENFRGKDPTLGCYALPFTSVSKGYRHIPLMDLKRNSLAPASLFVHIDIN